MGDARPHTAQLLTTRPASTRPRGASAAWYGEQRRGDGGRHSSDNAFERRWYGRGRLAGIRRTRDGSQSTVASLQLSGGQACSGRPPVDRTHTIHTAITITPLSSLAVCSLALSSSLNRQTSNEIARRDSVLSTTVCLIAEPVNRTLNNRTAQCLLAYRHTVPRRVAVLSLVFPDTTDNV